MLSIEQQKEYDDLISQGERFFQKKQWQDALLIYKKALLINPISMESLIKVGQIYQNVGQFRKAILTYRRIVELQGNDTPLFIRVHLLEMEKKYVSWDTLDKSFDFFKNEEVLSYGELSPFLSLSNPLTNRQLQVVAQSHRKKMKFLSPKLCSFDFSDRKKDQPKLRIGFMCGDFKCHPTGYLLTEFFELIDRNNFDVYIYDTHPEPNDPIHKRIYATTPHTVAIDKMNDQEAAERIYIDKIDVLIDLSGYTTFHRLGVLTYQPAVAQATYSGFPGTCGGIPGLDYILADEYVIPPDQKKFFDETVKYLTPSYRVMDRKQDVPMASLMRKHLHFDKDTIVLCCFNNSYKYTPNYFDLWARILKRVPKAILWFYRQDNLIEINIVKEFEKREIPSERVVFADFMPHTEHLARYQVADLFLDTENYNAHTTGAEALFMGCPIVTCPGDTFASRVCGTMLRALKLDELICKNITEYEEKVVELCNTPEALKKLREKTLEKVKTAPLFDMEKFTHSFEQNCREMFEESLDNFCFKSKKRIKLVKNENDKVPKISVIIPVYKTELYLRKCLDSVLAQTLKDIEIICVNDGSPDNSGKILDEYAQKDKRICVIHKENGGANSAYNRGLAEAKGEYVAFVDSDDWIAPNMYEDYYTKAKETDADIVTSVGFFLFQEDSNKTDFIKKIPFHKTNKLYTNLAEVSELIQGHVSHWNSIYKNTFLKENKIDFIHNKEPLGDLGFVYQIYGYAKSVYVIQNSYYHYLTRKENLKVRHNSDRDRLLIWLDNFNYAKDKLENASTMTIEKWYAMSVHEYRWFAHYFSEVRHDTHSEVISGYSNLFKRNLEKNRVRSSDFDEKEWENFLMFLNSPPISTNEIIHVFFAINDAYAKYLAVTLTSILYNTKRKVHFYILSSDLSENSKRLLEKLKDKWNFDIEYLNIRKEYFFKFPKCCVPYISVEANYRLLISDLKPELDKAIYLDSDLIVDSDIGELWDIDIGDNYIAAVPDPVGTSVPLGSHILSLPLLLDYRSRPTYINSGVLLMNTKKLRDNKMINTFFKVVEKYKEKLRFIDQDIISIACTGKIYYLNPRFNAAPLLHYEFSDEKEEAFIAPIIIHYAGIPKPWTGENNIPFMEYWKKYESILSRINSNER